jgi:hypothetical protein
MVPEELREMKIDLNYSRKLDEDSSQNMEEEWSKCMNYRTVQLSSIHILEYINQASKVMQHLEKYFLDIKDEEKTIEMNEKEHIQIFLIMETKNIEIIKFSFPKISKYTNRFERKLLKLEAPQKKHVHPHHVQIQSLVRQREEFREKVQTPNQ